jgi:hypothetical protein
MHDAASYSKVGEHLPLADVAHIVVAGKHIPRLDAGIKWHAILPAPLSVIFGKKVSFVGPALAPPAPGLAGRGLVHDLCSASAALAYKHGPVSAPS